MISKPQTHTRQGFTLIEILVAMTILATVMAIVGQTFYTTMRAWRKGEQLTEELHHGDFVMEQLVVALRSAAYFETAPDKYGFRLENESGGRYPADVISWVKSGTAFMPDESPLSHGLHRVEMTIDENEEGDDCVTVRAYPHLADEEEIEEAEAWYLSSVVKGLDCWVYIPEDEDWDEEWEDTNRVPGLVEIRLYMDPLEEFGEPVMIRRSIQIPVGIIVTQEVTYGGSGGSAGGAGEGAEGSGGAETGEEKKETGAKTDQAEVKAVQ